mgnify:CR=1 FL=1
MKLSYFFIVLLNLLISGELTFNILAQCVEYIYDGQQFYYAHETPQEEMVEFLESLSKEQFDKIENFLNEERYVKFFVNAHSKKKWGKTKIKMALLRKGIDSSIIKKYLDALDEEDYEKQLKTVAEKKWNSIRANSLREKKNKLLRFLLSKGYEMNRALQAIKQLEL